MHATTPLRIVHLTPAGGFGRVQHGGAERAVLELAGESAREGHIVTIIAPAEFLSAVELPIGVSAVPAEIDPRRVLGLLAIVKDLNPDVIVAHLLRGVIVGGIIRAIGHRKAAFVTNLHNSLNQAFEDVGTPLMRRRIVRWILLALHMGKGSATVAISRSNRDDLVEFDRFPQKKIELINNWVAPNFAVTTKSARELVRSSLSIPAESKMALFVGRLEHQKNPALAIQAIAGLDRSIVLVVAGDGSLREDLRKEADLRGVALRMIGNVKNIEDYMAAADVVVVTSRYEGFGRVAVEALATGTPVVANSVVGLQDALSPFPAEWYRFGTSEDADEWSGLIESAVGSATTEETRLARHDTVMDTYGLRTSVGHYLGLYQRLQNS